MISCSVVYDDKVEYIHDTSTIKQLLEVNTSSLVVEKQTLREDLRAFGKCGDELYLPFWEDRSFTEPDGTHTETETDDDGNETTREVQDYSTITIRIFFSNGLMVVTSEKNSRVMSAGFHCAMHYTDGHGSGTLPRTGREVYKNCESGLLDLTPGAAMTRWVVVLVL